MRRSPMLLLLPLALAGPALAQTHLTGAISLVRTGWGADQFAVALNVPAVDPAGCGTPDGYITHAAFPGYRTYYAAALTAYASKRPVTVVVHDAECFLGRPKLIGINLQP